MQHYENNRTREDEQGFMLIGVIVLVFLVMLALSVAAPKVALNLRRDREVESIHRGNEYIRAIQLYYRKFGRYPGTMDQLVKSTNIRFLRQKYPDPMTGKADWKLIHVGEAKTTVKGFFGQPLAGIPGGGGGLGSASSMASPGQPGSTVGGTQGTTGSTSFGSSGGMGTSSPGGSSSVFSLSSGTSSPSSSSSPSGPGSSGAATVSSSSASNSSSGIGSQSATSFTGGGAPIVGIGSSRSGASITILNEQATYQTWEFIYDPRIEQLKAKAALLGGGTNSGFGSSGSPSGFGSSSPTSPMSPGLNSSPSGSFGSSGGSGFGSGGTSSPAPTTPQ